MANNLQVKLRIDGDAGGLVGAVRAANQAMASLQQSARLAPTASQQGPLPAAAEAARQADLHQRSAAEAARILANAMRESVAAGRQMQTAAAGAERAMRGAATAAAGMQDAARSTGNALHQVGQQAGGAAAEARGLASVLDGIPGTLARIAAAAAAGLGLSAVLKTGSETEGRLAAMEAVTGSAGQARVELAWLREEADKLGLAFEPASKAFAKFSAAAKGTSLAGGGVRDVFDGVAQAARVMNLSTDETDGVLLALSQMLSKGTVQAEELRGQLGERLPGAFNMTAKAMGMTTAELGKALEQGKVLAEDMLPKLAAELRRSVGGGMDKAAAGYSAALNRMGNALYDLRQALADGGITAVATAALRGLADVVKIAVAAAREMPAAWETVGRYMDAASESLHTNSAGWRAIRHAAAESVEFLKILAEHMAQFTAQALLAMPVNAKTAFMVVMGEAEQAWSAITGGMTRLLARMEQAWITVAHFATQAWLAVKTEAAEAIASIAKDLSALLATAADLPGVGEWAAKAATGLQQLTTAGEDARQEMKRENTTYKDRMAALEAQIAARQRQQKVEETTSQIVVDGAMAEREALLALAAAKQAVHQGEIPWPDPLPLAKPMPKQEEKPAKTERRAENIIGRVEDQLVAMRIRLLPPEERELAELNRWSEKMREQLTPQLTGPFAAEAARAMREMERVVAASAEHIKQTAWQRTSDRLQDQLFAVRIRMLPPREREEAELYRWAQGVAEELSKYIDHFPDQVHRAMEDLARTVADKQREINGGWVDGAQRALRDYLDDAGDIAGQSERLFSNAFSGMEDALVEFVMTGKMSFSSLTESILRDLARMAIKASITTPLFNWMQGLFGGPQTKSAMGNVFDGGHVTAFASGGAFADQVVSTPTLFPLGLMGEDGPEAIMPLTRTNSGRLGVVAVGGAGAGQHIDNSTITLTVAPVIHMHSDGGANRGGGSQDGLKIAGEVARLVRQAVIDEIHTQRRPGGALAMAWR